MKLDEDNRVAKQQGMHDKMNTIIAKVAASMSFFTPELLSASEETLLSYITEEPALSQYEFVIRDVLREKEHVLPAEQENLLAQMSEVTDATNTIFTMLNLSLIHIFLSHVFSEDSWKCSCRSRMSVAVIDNRIAGDHTVWIGDGGGNLFLIHNKGDCQHVRIFFSHFLKDFLCAANIFVWSICQKMCIRDRGYQLTQVRTTNMGSLFELTYTINLKSEQEEKQFIDDIRCRNGNLKIVCGLNPENKEMI